MPSGSRSNSRPGAGPGRGRPRARTVARAETPRPKPQPKQQVSDPDVEEPIETPAPDPRSRGVALKGRRSSITTRAIALTVVLLILTISYASSLRIYFAQAEKISATRVDIADRRARIEQLREQLGLWEDDAYVRQQARERLGWVIPGEIGFRVIGPDGKPLGGGAEIGKPASKSDQPSTAWWQRLKGSVQTADKPAPTAAPTKKGEDKPITENTEPR